MDSLVDRLIEDEQLSQMFVSPPEAVVIPVRGNPHLKSVTVSILVTERALTLTLLSRACARIVKLFRNEKDLEGMFGMEIFASAVVPTQIATRRVFRLSIPKESLERAEQLTAEDLGKAVPFDHVRCHRYVSHIDV